MYLLSLQKARNTLHFKRYVLGFIQGYDKILKTVTKYQKLWSSETAQSTVKLNNIDRNSSATELSKITDVSGWIKDLTGMEYVPSTNTNLSDSDNTESAENAAVVGS